MRTGHDGFTAHGSGDVLLELRSGGGTTIAVLVATTADQCAWSHNTP